MFCYFFCGLFVLFISWVCHAFASIHCCLYWGCAEHECYLSCSVSEKNSHNVWTAWDIWIRFFVQCTYYFNTFQPLVCKMVRNDCKWVWSGNTTITNRRQPHGTARKSHSTITRHQEDKLGKATSSLFTIKIICNTRMGIK